MVKLLKKTIIISVLLHLTAFLSINTNTGFKQNKKGGSGSRLSKGVSADNIIEKTKKSETVAIDIKHSNPEVTIKKKTEKKKKSIKDCPGAWYGGIGIHVSSHPLGDEIIRIFKGYPADLSGLRVNDIIVSTNKDSIVGPPGTTVKLTIMRNGKYIEFIIVRGKICYGAK